MIQTIHLIGAVNGDIPYQEQEIRQLLSVQASELTHGKSFTGRISTQIHANAEHIIKIRSELRLDEKSAIRWVQQALVKEKNYHVHHPHKTWFVAVDATQNNAIIGNICPRLQALHSLIQTATPALAITECLNCLQHALTLYFRVASEFNIRLDEGLSNFGLTASGHIYYLDDDFYQWDRFISCAHMLGVYIRSLTWLRGEAASDLGSIVHELIIDHFNDSQYLTVLAEQLRDVFMPAVAQQAALLEFTNALKHKPATVQSKASSLKAPITNTRYFAILADVHANLPALDTVLTFLAEENIQQGIVLGDVVGYGPHPSACIERLQNSDFVVLKGNHDHGLATQNFAKGFSSTAAWVLKWCQERVSAEEKQWLLDLPPVWYEETWMAVHGAPIDPTFFNAYVYEMTYHDNLDVLARKQIRYCFHGHTHQPGVYARRHHQDNLYKEPEIDLFRFEHALICPGSIGQPRNRVPGAQFAVYDREQQHISYHCLDYDVEALIQEMEAEGFPDTLSRLLRGKL